MKFRLNFLFNLNRLSVDVQISQGRVAARIIGHQRTEFIVVDMKSGQRILNCNQDLNLYIRQTFLLRKERLILVDFGRIDSLVFWV